MKKTIKFLEAWKTYVLGDVVEMDEAMAKTLITAGVAEEHDPAAAGREEAKKLAEEKAAKEEQTKTIVQTVKDMFEGEPELGSKIAGTKDLSDEDPTHGYCPNADKAERDELKWGLGCFMRDVAVHSGGAKFAGVKSETDLFQKSLERSAKMVIDAKAAGTGMEVGQDSLGGALLPPGFSTELVDVSAYDPFVRPRARRTNLTTLSMDLPLVKDVDRSGGTIFGGVQVFFPAENEAPTASRPQFEQIQLKLKALEVLMYASHEMITFSPLTVGSMLFDMGGTAIMWKEDTEFYAGTGAGRPLGILNSGAKIAVAAEAGQAAGTIVFENVVKMLARARIFNPAATIWVANRTTMPQLMVMKLDIGTGGTAVFLPANGASGRPFDTLFGFPILYTEKAKTAGTEGDLVLWDVSRYIVADHQSGPELAQSIHIKFEEGQTAFRIIKYVDGQPMDRTPYTPENGDTLSPVITLATRPRSDFE